MPFTNTVASSIASAPPDATLPSLDGIISKSWQQKLNEEALFESVMATTLQTLNRNAPDVVYQMFRPALDQIGRTIAHAKFSTENVRHKKIYLSPIGIMHLFREYFFQLGTFLGPPVGHIWLSPGATEELLEVNTRRQLQEMTVEQSVERTTTSETTQTSKDELSDAVSEENRDDMKLGVSTSASGGYGPFFQASGTLSYSTEESKKQAKEQTRKTMREQSTRLSSQVRQNYKTSFRTVTETTDTSSRRYVLQNKSDRLVNYELSRKMRKVAVQVQDLGQRLCWQVFVDSPGDMLGAVDFVYAHDEALNPTLAALKPPDDLPYPEDKIIEYSPPGYSYPWRLTSGSWCNHLDNSTQRRVFLLDEGHAAHDWGLCPFCETSWPNQGNAHTRVSFRETFPLPDPPPGGYEAHEITAITFDTSTQTTIDLFNRPDESPQGLSIDLSTKSFTIRVQNALTKQSQTTFKLSIKWVATQAAKNKIDAINQRNAAAYSATVAAEQERAYYDTLRKKLSSRDKVKQRSAEVLRAEERSVIYHNILTRLYGSELASKTISAASANFHAASEMIQYYFDIDSMLYFVAPDWWKPYKGERPPSYMVTEETQPAPFGASLGWTMQPDGDNHRNAFLNSPWVKAVLPMRPGREKEAIEFLERPEAAGIDGLDGPYPFDDKIDAGQTGKI